MLFVVVGSMPLYSSNVVLGVELDVLCFTAIDVRLVVVGHLGMNWQEQNVSRGQQGIRTYFDVVTICISSITLHISRIPRNKAHVPSTCTQQ